mmetsp:Transcript_28407/g.69144  ORF Transcript_28407/g.69144 Transcript_28407/m.69144 type:complete len:609 (-) Transcript_28407:164-1990(-)|eukprot:CAMPEP_0113472324 /NCGR_PEP_ID=MMETSP0014_2-20120614/17455_1 /TAXON_ID=2857 /ORGANISM="Nitzschia sp." /LENGTH=608 /DNA_ID=CAMNT_0000365027 /DNA_START=129 /DNA_END=1955 /DNA_ORIENTATION=- /assembly_acc=CAM_ASM_000159
MVSSSSSSTNFPIVPPPDAIDQEPIPVHDIVDLQFPLDNDDLEDGGGGGGGGGKHDTTTGDNATAGDLSEEENENNNETTIIDTNSFGGGGNGSSTHNYRRIVMRVGVGIVVIVAVVVGVVLVSQKGDSSSAPSSSSSSPDSTESSAFDPFTCTSSEGARSSTVSVCPELVHTPFSNSTATAVVEEVGFPIYGEGSGDLFGTAVSVNCDATIVAIGSSQHDDRSGHVKVYKWLSAETMLDAGVGLEGENLPADISKVSDVDGSWIQLGQTIDGINSKDQFGHAVSISSDGYMLAISGRFADTTYDNGTIAEENLGSVRVYQWSTPSDAWQRIGQVLWGENVFDQSGRSVEMNWDGTRIVIGATGNDDGGDSAGHARVYELTSRNTWEQVGQDIDGESEEDYSGNAMSMSADGTVVAVGAYQNDGTGNTTEDAGHVRVYQFDDTSERWIQLGSDIDGDASGDWHGQSVALSGDGTRLIVGAPGNNDRFWPGISKVYDFIENEWNQVGEDLEGGGYSVDISIDGRRVVLGSHRGFENGANSGQVLIYDFDDETKNWISVLGGENSISGESGSLFGTAVALSSTGERVIASAPGISGYAGSVMGYDVCPVA